MGSCASAATVVLPVKGSGAAAKFGLKALLETGGRPAVEGVEVAAKTVPETRVFWSGGRTAQSAAEKWAGENGGTTLEMTPAGRATVQATEGLPWSQAKPMWEQASADFASGARGTVHVFHSAAGVSMNSVWRTVEYPILQDNGVNMIFHTVGEGW